jgi:trigger factor
VEEFMEQLEEDLIEQKEREDQDEYLNQIFEKILEDTEVKFPPQMLENEVEGEINELASRLEAQGMELATYLNMQDMDEEALRDEIRPGAEKRIQRGLVIGRISEDANLDISTEEITQEYQALLDNYFGENDEERQAFMSSNQSISLLNQISSQVISRKTIDFLVALAKGEDISPYQKDEDQDQDGDQDDVEQTQVELDEPVSEQEELELEDETETGDESDN